MGKDGFLAGWLVGRAWLRLLRANMTHAHMAEPVQQHHHN